MNILLWVLQALTALLYAASGVMKVFMFDKVSVDVPSFGALPRNAWRALGLIELVCTAALILPGVLHWLPVITPGAATVSGLAGAAPYAGRGSGVGGCFAVGNPRSPKNWEMFSMEL